MSRIKILQIVSGIFLGIFFVAGTLGTVGYFLWSKFTIIPSRPTFAEENKVKKVAKVAASSSSPSPSPSTTASPSPSPSPSKSPEDSSKGEHQARVLRSRGISLRADPNRRSERVGSVSYNEKVIVLEKSDDGEWTKIRSVESQDEGWVRSGNISEEESSPSPNR